MTTFKLVHEAIDEGYLPKGIVAEKNLKPDVVITPKGVLAGCPEFQTFINIIKEGSSFILRCSNSTPDGKCLLTNDGNGNMEECKALKIIDNLKPA